MLCECISEKLSLHGPVKLAINLDGFNPVTQVLVSWLAPNQVAGMAFDQRRRRLLPMSTGSYQHFLQDPEWDSPAFLERNNHVFTSNYIAELFSVLAGVSDYCDPTQINLPAESPPFLVPDVLIHCTTARAAKIWPFHNWKIVLDYISNRGWSVGLVGGAPHHQVDSYNGEMERIVVAANAFNRFARPDYFVATCRRL